MTLVYFVRPVGGGGRVKIGCSRIPVERLKVFAQWSPVDLEIVAATPGTFDDEMALHYRFREQFVRHEWFDASAELDALIVRVRAGDGLPRDDTPVATIRAWRAKYYYARRGTQRTDEQRRAQTENARLANIRRSKKRRAA